AQKDEDILAFDKYAEVLVERLRDPDMWPVSLGIYAQWGAGKVRNQDVILVHFFGVVPMTCILASFDAWLFADSDVLWAFLISKI
ncbi:unnamed protein product, partial [Scytosiphon promiscuus]